MKPLSSLAGILVVIGMLLGGCGTAPPNSPPALAFPTALSGNSTSPAASAKPGQTLLVYRGAMIWGSVAWSPDGKQIISGAENGFAQVWDAATGQMLQAFGAPKSPAYGLFNVVVAWSPNGQQIAMANEDVSGSVTIWDASSDKTTVTYDHQEGRITALAWSPDGTRVVSASFYSTAPTMTSPNSVQVWNAQTGQELFPYNGHSAFVNALAWSPDGTKIASASTDKTVQIWDAATGKTLLTYTGHQANVDAVAWSPDGKWIASGDDNDMVQIWDATTGKKLLTYTGHTYGITQVAWSPDGTRIASSSASSIGVADNNSMQVWNPVTDHQLLSYDKHSGDVLSFAWSPDGTKIASASDDGTVQVWTAPEPG